MLMNRQPETIACPCCRKTVKRFTISTNWLVNVLTEKEREILEVLIGAQPHAVDLRYIADRACADAFGDVRPGTDNLIRVRFTSIRKKIAPYGWTISMANGRYFLTQEVPN